MLQSASQDVEGWQVVGSPTETSLQVVDSDRKLQSKPTAQLTMENTVKAVTKKLFVMLTKLTSPKSVTVH